MKLEQEEMWSRMQLSRICSSSLDMLLKLDIGR